MTVPSEIQRQALADYLLSCERPQWTAIVRWMIERLCADDQEFTAAILFREAERRYEKANEFKQAVDKTPITKYISEVFGEVGVKLVMQ